MTNLSKEGKQEIQEKINYFLNDNNISSMSFSDIHNEIFNTDYFIIGYYEAEQWLINNYGIFNAIEKVRDYEMDNFGELTTDISDSEKLVNMLVYILGEEMMAEMNILAELN